MVRDIAFSKQLPISFQQKPIRKKKNRERNISLINNVVTIYSLREREIFPPELSLKDTLRLITELSGSFA